ncbi:hypothetical protein IJJ27_00480 [bacterium]|nr:hypothetical protein [bacterium]
MKKNQKLLLAALALAFFVSAYSTYAIYSTSVSGSATVTAAIWDVKFKNGATELTDTFNVTLTGSDCSNNHVAEGKIAPGAQCTKTITLDAGSSEVDVTYEASTGSVTATKNNQSISTSGANEFTATLSPANGTITYGNNTRTTDLTLTVSWAGTDETAVNAADVTLNGATITVPVTLTAKQDVSAAP